MEVPGEKGGMDRELHTSVLLLWCPCHTYKLVSLSLSLEFAVILSWWCKNNTGIAFLKASKPDCSCAQPAVQIRLLDATYTGLRAGFLVAM